MMGNIRAARMAFLPLLTFLALSRPALISAQESAPPAGSEIVELRSNEPELYPNFEDVAIRSMERQPSGVGLRLGFVSDTKDFSHFLYSTNRGPFREMENGSLLLTFEDKHSVDVQYMTTVIRSVSRSGIVSKDYHIDVNYYPRELYAKAGQKAPGYVIVKKTDIPIVSSRVSDWVCSRPTAEDVEFARVTFGRRVEDGGTSLEKARRLARALLDDLQPHRGVPSDTMRASPFEQYRRAMSGKDFVWCGNLADIFIYSCACFDIPARMIKMIRYWSKGEAYDLLMAEGHATTEIFDEGLNRWIWIDLTFLMTGMELSGYGPIHMAELHRCLNHRDKIKDLTAIEYDPVTKTEKRVSVLASTSLNSLLNFFKKDQTFTYRRMSSK
jgi:hypothetical protein